MCEHKWIPFILELEYPIDASTNRIYFDSRSPKIIVTKVICVECKEEKIIAESPTERYAEMFRHKER